MWGAAIGSIVSIASSIHGARVTAKENAERQREIERLKRDNANWYNRRYYEDATQRGDAKRILNKTREAMLARNKQAEGARIVSGGTEESTAAMKEAGNEAMADAVSRINAQADARKDNIEEQYRRYDTVYAQGLNDLKHEKAQNVATATSQVGSAVGNLASSIDSGNGRMTVKQDTTNLASSNITPDTSNWGQVQQPTAGIKSGPALPTQVAEVPIEQDLQRKRL